MMVYTQPSPEETFKSVRVNGSESIGTTQSWKVFDIMLEGAVNYCE